MQIVVINCFVICGKAHLHAAVFYFMPQPCIHACELHSMCRWPNLKCRANHYICTPSIAQISSLYAQAPANLFGCCCKFAYSTSLTSATMPPVFAALVTYIHHHCQGILSCISRLCAAEKIDPFFAFQVSAPISVVALHPLVYPPSPWLPSPFLELAQRPFPLSPRPLNLVKGTGARWKSPC